MASTEAQQMQNSRSGFLAKQNLANSLNDNFDQMLKEQEDNLNNYDPNNKDYLGNITDSLAYQIEESSLACPALEQNPIFQKLRLRMRQFFVAQEEYRRNGPTKQQLQFQQKCGLDFTYKIELNKGLKRLLRAVVVTKDKQGQLKNLGKVYAWYFGKLESIGQMSNQEKDEEEIFMNPQKIEEIQIRRQEKQEEKREKLLNEEIFEQKEKKMYDEGERSIHQQIPPAKDRITDYKRKSFGKLFSNKVDERPTSGVTSMGQADITTQAQSVFEEDERSVYSHPFAKFYTTGEPVVFKTVNRFEGRSNYMNYYPSDNMVEQKLEKIWYQNQNRQVQEKRRDEELKQHVKEWTQAKSRIEIEIQRKKEHQNFGTNFEAARGFVRKNWKTKNFNPDNNPLLEESSTDEEEYGEEDQYAQEVGTYTSNKDDYKAEEPEYEDQEIDEDNEEDDDEQQDKMTKLKQQSDAQKGMNTRGIKSAYPKLRGAKGFQTQSAKVFDLTADQIKYGLRPNTAIQIKQIQALNEFNKGLPKNKQKDALPMIQATNIGTTQVIKKDYKKQKTELITKYTPIGLIDDFLDPNEAQSSKFSMHGKIRNLSVQSAKKKVEELRKYQGTLINANVPIDENNLDNIFNASAKGNETYTLSVYNRPDKSKRPMTAQPVQNNWFKKYEKLQPVPEEEEQPKDTRLPDFKEPKGVNLMARGCVDGYRLEQMNEIESIKERLARDGQTLSMVTLQRAILMPEEIEYMPGQRKYPTPGEQLMANPFPKKKKKKGKKKKKKSKK